VCITMHNCHTQHSKEPHTHTHTTVLRPFFRDHSGEPVPDENIWTLWCKGRLTEADAPTIQLGGTPSGLTSAHLHHPHFFTGRMPFLPPNQQCQSTEGKIQQTTVLIIFSLILQTNVTAQMLSTRGEGETWLLVLLAAVAAASNARCLTTN